ncbi:hypothetical protein ScPMuIL_017967 [Solemya velum]
MTDLACERYAFLVEWYDHRAALNRHYQLFFYPKDESIEMFDVKNHRTFLKRTKQDVVHIQDLYIGSTVNIFARQLKFIDFADDYSKSKLQQMKERTLGMIKPDAVSKMGDIIDQIQKSGFLITKLKMVQLNRNEAFEFYEEHKGKQFLDNLLQFVTSGPVIAFEMLGDSAISMWRTVLGPTDPAIARKEAPKSIRARFGTSTTENACHGSDSPAAATREIDFFFPTVGPTKQNTAQFNDCTCCIIKPHAVLEGLTGQIISAITEANFEVSAIQMFHMEKANAEEFYEVYKGVVQEYNQMVTELTSGPCIVLNIRAKDAAVTFREMVGPADPEVARNLRPRTLRAKFGKDKIKNAIHCTDLPDDGVLEVEYFFKILDR